MSNTVSVALSSQMALRRQMDVIANNIANVSTPAFKGEKMLFSEFVERLGGEAPLSLVQDFGTARDTRQGSLTRTGNPFDVALEGDGYLAVQTESGVRYTRNGRLRLDANGQVVDALGDAVLGDGNAPILIPPDAQDVSIGRDGTISTAQGVAGKLGIQVFDKETDLVPAANGLYVTEAQPQPATNTLLLQGMIEESNVQPILEITHMMAVSRSYSFAKDMLDGEDSRIKNAIDHLGKSA
jgi:flagellar basal-body rod protein FlgF